MIIVRLTGGLGNQLFQYALGRALAVRYSVPLYIDVSEFEFYKLHQFALHRFAITAKPVPPSVGKYVSGRFAPGLIRPVVTIARRALHLRRAPRILRERGFGFDPSVFRVAPPLYLRGYWQSEKYFAHCEDTIRSEFEIPTPAVGRDLDLARRMEDCDSIGLHIRRADYVTDPNANKVHGTCSPEYYERAIMEVTKDLDRPHIFVFSDDPAWCRKNFRSGHQQTYVDHNDAQRNFEDLRLMSLCKHNIIANSTFSWWGAWLNRYSAKQVVAPARWFGTGRDISDLIPRGWMVM